MSYESTNLLISGIIQGTEEANLLFFFFGGGGAYTFLQAPV